MAEYTLTYDIQGGVGDAPVGGAVEEGTTLVLDDGTGITKEGFIFGGWSETTGGDAIVGEFTMPGADTTIYAVWTEDGSGEGGEEEPEEDGKGLTFPGEFIEECDRIIALCRDLKDARDYDLGIPARQVVKETCQDKLMGLRKGESVKIRNIGFKL